MLKVLYTAVALGMAVLVVAPVLAQDQGQRPQRGGPGGPGGRGGFGGGFGTFGGPRNVLLEALDANRDGELSAEEIAGAVAALKKLDKNSDGKLSADELRPAPPTTEETVARYLENDKNKDGKLTADEVPERMAGFLARADEDGNGEITKAELTKFVENMASRFGGGRGFGGDRPGGRSDGEGGNRPQRPNRPE